MDFDGATTPSNLPALSSLRSVSPSEAPPSPTSQSSSPAPPSSLTPPSPPPPPSLPSSPSPPSSPSASGPPVPHDASPPMTPTPSRTVKHWPWRPNVYARLKIWGHILPVKLAEVTSTPPSDRPFGFIGDECYNARFWACVYIEDLDYCWWAFTTAIILLDEILRHPEHEDALAPATAEIRSLVNALRALRDAVAADENYGGSRLWLPLSSGETLDEAISTTHVCWPHPDSSNGCRQVLFSSRNRIFSDNGLNALIARAYTLCKGLHASSELLYFGALPQEPMSRVEAYMSSGVRAFVTELKDLRLFVEVFNRLLPHQGMDQYNSPALNRALSSRPVHDVVGRGAYGQVYKIMHPYWGDLAVKEPLPDQVTEQNQLDELISHFTMQGSERILPVVAWTRYKSLDVVAMQWAENGSLDKFLARNPDSSRALLLLNVAVALRDLHNSKRIHGDLHMGNIVVSKDGDGFLCDFGLSKEVYDSNALDHAADGTVYGGVPIYMAPELYEPGACRTFASEVFAFGMVVFQAYSGTRPFVVTAQNEVARYDAAIIKAIVNGTRPTRDQVARDDFSDEMWNLVQDCWNQDPAHRPSMDEVVERMFPLVPWQDKMGYVFRVAPLELTILRPGDVALEDAMELHEKSDQLRWTLSRMEHFGLKAFFTDHMEARDKILMDAICAILSGPSKLMDVEECDFEVVLRLARILYNDPSSLSSSSSSSD